MGMHKRCQDWFPNGDKKCNHRISLISNNVLSYNYVPNIARFINIISSYQALFGAHMY
jgi:hypothetical protein